MSVLYETIVLTTFFDHYIIFFFFSSRRRHTRLQGDWSSDVCSSDLDETPDQEKAIDAVLSDMQSDTPMDRLVCGDVGYGKTEVALRATLLAVLGGKQVAVLAPTTVLAEQHFATFSERYTDLPVRLAALSRFRSRAEQLQTVADVAAGKIDV